MKYLVLLFPLLLLGCGDGPVTPPPPTPQSVDVTLDPAEIFEGSTAQASVTVRYSDGSTTSPSSGVTWSSSNESVAEVGSNGRVVGRSAGEARITASVHDLSGSAGVTVLRRPVASVDVSPPEATLEIGESVDLEVRVLDDEGNELTGRTVEWSSSDEDVATVSDAGVVTAHAAGEATITAASGEVTGSATVVVLAPNEQGLSLTGFDAEVLLAGEVVGLTGEGFRSESDRNHVAIDGVEAEVVEASATSLRVRVPERDRFGCRPTREVDVSVTVGGSTASLEHPLRVARLRQLEVGQSFSARGSADSECNELEEADGRYLISVFNAGTAPGAVSPFRLLGADGGGTVGASAHRSAAIEPAGAGHPDRLGASEATRHGPEAHHAILERNLGLLSRLGPPWSAAADAGAPLAAPTFALEVGDESVFRIPDTGGDDLCNGYDEVTARVVYAGSRAVVYEDVENPLAGDMDAALRRMGERFDDTMFELLKENFGDPLALNDQLTGDGRIRMLFSAVVNDAERVAGFVFSGDLFPRADCASSDQMEIFYAVVPTSRETGFGTGTVANWEWTMPGTVIHEVKHITSFVERISRSASTLEELWLEEATARMSEELWARTIYGYGQNGDTGYRASIYCEVRPTWPECEGSPQVMVKHFSAVHDYYADVEDLTPIGRRDPDDWTFYGSGWLLARHAIDHSSRSEASFLKALTQEPDLSGIENLVVRAQRDYADILADWTLAHAVDLFGLAASRAELKHPTWNTEGIFAGLNEDFPNGFAARPLRTRTVSFGTFDVEVEGVRAGTAAIFDLSGQGSGGQMIHVAGPGGGSPAPLLGISVLRVER